MSSNSLSVDLRYYNRHKPTMDLFKWWKKGNRSVTSTGASNHRPDDGRPHWTDWWFKMEPIEDEL